MQTKLKQVVRSRVWIFCILVFGMVSCQLSHVEEVVERTREHRPAWVKMNLKGLWKGRGHQYMVVSFRDKNPLKHANLKLWLQSQLEKFPKNMKTGHDLVNAEVADLFYEKTAKDLGRKTETFHVVYALLRMK